MKINFNAIDRVISAKIECNKYNNCFLNEIEFDDDTKKFIEDIICDFQKGIIENNINIFIDDEKNDIFLKKILDKFPNHNNKFYYDINSCIGNIYGITAFINDIFKLRVCKNIDIE